MIDEMRNSSDEEYRQLADISIAEWKNNNPGKLTTITDTNLANGVFRDGTHAFAAVTEDIVNDDYYQYLEEKYGTSLHRSYINQTVLSENPYLNWISKKRWPLNEELNIHMMLFQQVKYIY